VVARQQRGEQLFVDPPQPGDAEPLAKLVHEAHPRQRVPIGQVGKPSPVPLLGQHLQ